MHNSVAGWFCSQGNFTVVTPCRALASTDSHLSFLCRSKKNDDNNERANKPTNDGRRQETTGNTSARQHMNAKDKSDYFRCRTRINANTCDENLNSWNMQCYIQIRIHLIVTRTHTHRPSYDANNNNLSLAASISNFNEHFYEIFSLNCALVCCAISSKKKKKNSHSL